MSLYSRLIQRFHFLGQKNKRLLLNTLFSFFVKGGGLIISLFTLPVYMGYFENQEALGLWFTALSILSWILTFDLGIGNGLRNHLVQPFANNDMQTAKRYISSAYILTGAIVIAVFIAGYFLSPFVSWNKVFNVSDRIVSPGVLVKMVRLVFTGVMLQFFLRLINSVFYALQQSPVPGLLGLLSSILLLVLVSLAHTNNIDNNLVKLSYFNIIAANLPLLAATLIIFAKKLRHCIPSFAAYNKQVALKIMLLGGAFFWLQIMFMLITNTNEFLISWLSGTANVVPYKIYNSLFNVIGSIFLLALTPVWSEVTEAFARNEHAWIKTLYKRLRQVGLLAICGEIVLIFALQTLVDLWLKNKAIKINLWYAFVFAVSGTIFIWNAILSNIVYGIGKLKVALIFLTFGAVVNFPLAYLFARLTDSWISIMIANILSMLPYCIVQSLWLRKYFRQAMS